MRQLAEWDVVSAASGQAATQMFVHEDGADSSSQADSQGRSHAGAADSDGCKNGRNGLKTGRPSFLEIRETIAFHTETRTSGPLTAAQWLTRLDAWRAKHPAAAKDKTLTGAGRLLNGRFQDPYSAA